MNPVEKRIRRGLVFTRMIQLIIRPSRVRAPLRWAVSHARLPEGVDRESATAGSVACEWMIPRRSYDNEPEQGVLLYLHGGGFVAGLTPQHLRMAARLGQALNRRVLMVDYRLAPEHPFPAALDDCETAYRWLLSVGWSSNDIVLAGDSAGGNLVIALLMKLRDSHAALPKSAACLSPVVDLTPGGNVREGFKDPLLPERAGRFYTESYVGTNDPSNPLISPIFGNPLGLPPILIHVGDDEILRDGAVRFATQAQNAGAPVTVSVFPRMWHVWQLYATLPQTQQSLGEIAEFLRAH